MKTAVRLPYEPRKPARERGIRTSQSYSTTQPAPINSPRLNVGHYAGQPLSAIPTQYLRQALATLGDERCPYGQPGILPCIRAELQGREEGGERL
ncbi:MAG TPA: hypothetical protein VKU00_19920 [Chthonomonadaceae bacterium]|nr:hypothetical protein [Chthonomonadaceae bacterium]